MRFGSGSMRFAVLDFAVLIVCASSVNGVFMSCPIILVNDILVVELLKTSAVSADVSLSKKIDKLTLSVGFLLRGANG